MLDTLIVADLRSEKMAQFAAAQMEQQAALLEYVAVMADVELPEDDESEMSTDE